MTVTSITPPPTSSRALRLPCQQGNPDDWFAEDSAAIGRAKAGCARCPIAAQCLAGAIERGERYGVWGGANAEAGELRPDAPDHRCPICGHQAPPWRIYDTETCRRTGQSNALRLYNARRRADAARRQARQAVAS
jgi:hypothetical protein